MRDSKFVRGQIWWMEGYEVHKEGGKRRPALIVSNNIINSNFYNENITVVPLTSNTERLDIKTNVAINRHNRTLSVAKCGEVVTIYKNQLVSYESMVDKEIMDKIEEAMKFALGMEQTVVPKVIVETENNVSRETPETSDSVPLATEEIKPYENLMESQIKRNGKKIVWDGETEYLFMKIYTECGIEKAATKFDMTFKSATTKAYLLRKKYPEFEKLKCGKASVNYGK